MSVSVAKGRTASVLASEIVGQIAGPRVDVPIRPVAAMRLRGITERVATARVCWEEERPELDNRVFRDVGERELRLIINLGFVFGLLFGIPVVGITFLMPDWWVLPACGVIVGWVTNLISTGVVFSDVAGTDPTIRGTTEFGKLRIKPMAVPQLEDAEQLKNPLVIEW